MDAPPTVGPATPARSDDRGFGAEQPVGDGTRPSWHARSGRLTARKRWALDELAARVAPRRADPFEGRPRVALEIGGGTGEAALALAATQPALLVLVAEVHKASLARLLLDLEAAQLDNVRVLAGDGRTLLAAAEAVATAPEGAGVGPLELVRAFFPDPWPKRRHHDRRLVDERFVRAAASALRPDGLLELATDDAAYAAAMTAAIRAETRFVPAGPPARADRPATYYERRATDAGRTVHDLRVRRRHDPGAPTAGTTRSTTPDPDKGHA